MGKCTGGIGLMECLAAPKFDRHHDRGGCLQPAAAESFEPPRWSTFGTLSGVGAADMRNCLLRPPDEAEHAATFLNAAANAVLNNQKEEAADLLRKADIRTLHAYAAFVMSPTAELLGFKKRTRQVQQGALSQSLGPRMPTGANAEVIFGRDGFRCRYCGCRVVRPGVRSLLTALFPDVVQWPGGKGGDQLKHAAFYALNGVLDHVAPYARGGSSSIENIVTACWPCNFGKEDHTIEELRLSDPRDRAQSSTTGTG